MKVATNPGSGGDGDGKTIRLSLDSWRLSLVDKRQ
jgi:hypothetical protein